MASVRAVAGGRSLVTGRQATALVGGLVVLGLAIHAFGPGRAEWIRATVVIFGSLVIQAIPFVLIGALAAAAIEVFVPIRVFERVGRLPRPIQLPVSAFAGMVFPICECGSVPVARQLITRGLAPSAAITFMLAAPVMNPVVIASTVYAYGGRNDLWTMVLGRIGLALLVAMAGGWAVGGLGRDRVLRAAPAEPSPIEVARPEHRWRRLAMHVGTDFLFLGRFLLIGAAIAAIVQTFLPQQALASIAATPIVDIVVMMLLAALLSLCSESDAFIAASFSHFGSSAQLAFLVFGPMVDMKLGALYAATFRRAAAAGIVAVAAGVTLVGATWIGVLTG